MGKVPVIKAVVDTNVVISGLLFSGLPGRVISLWKNRTLLPFASKDIIREYLRVLAYPKFSLSRQEIDYLFYQEILPFFEEVVPAVTYAVIEEDPSDDKFIHCAISASVPIIISGDPDILRLDTFKSLSILSPHDFLSKFS